MRLLHVSDTHVGFAAYHRLTPEGLNQREADFAGAFREAIDVALRERVDVVLHSGDLFDSVRPTNRAIHHVLSEVARLGDTPFVVISGNHEAPRLRETGAVLRLLDFLPNATPIYKGRYERVRIGDLAIHGIPHAASNEALAAELRRVEADADARYQVAALHAGIVGVGDFRTGEFNEQTIALNDLPHGMDYTALGHYHGALEVAPDTWYAGSTERCTFKEANETKGVNLVDLAAGTTRRIALTTRRMTTLPAVHLEGAAEIEMARLVYQAIRDADLEGAIARLKVTGLPPHVYATLDFSRIRQLASTALHFEFQPELARRDATGATIGSIGALADEFETYLANQPVGDTRDDLAAKARHLLAAAETQEGSA